MVVPGFLLLLLNRAAATHAKSRCQLDARQGPRPLAWRQHVRAGAACDCKHTFAADAVSVPQRRYITRGRGEPAAGICFRRWRARQDTTARGSASPKSVAADSDRRRPTRHRRRWRSSVGVKPQQQQWQHQPFCLARSPLPLWRHKPASSICCCACAPTLPRTFKINKTNTSTATVLAAAVLACLRCASRHTCRAHSRRTCRDQHTWSAAAYSVRR